jgi:catechol 2,3-dioxygenase-like lactoylglutathione lyase family enzyme
MRLPAGHARKLFLGFTCSIMFLVVFALLIAHNSEAESSSFAGPSVENYPLTIGIPTGHPERTIEFYEKLGFRTSEGLPRGFDIVCMEKEGTPYKLEICHNRFSETAPPAGAVSGMTFRVKELSNSIKELEGKGLKFVETRAQSDGVTYASLKDPNGIRIKLFQQ